MKTPHSSKRRALDCRRQEGFALVVVLAILMLLIALAVGLLNRASTEKVVASGAREAASARQLADTVVSFVQGQLALATSQGSSVAWVSQPGLVRTFNANGSALKIYKLYSADDMIAATIAPEAETPPGNWHASPALWTDLNAFVTDRNGRRNYPIIDPDATAEGFAVTSVPAASGSGANPLPMPVKWLYMLRDGTLVAPEGGGAVATIAGETYPAGRPHDPVGNPVIGRIAFWTDDDTCKVNVNTASVGTYWDTPHARSSQEIAFANFQPARNEFQRYPGHPAMTSLSVVFPSLSPEQIYQIVPRIIGGGSNEGTSIASGVLTPDTDRLYSDIDELIFRPTRGKNPDLSRTQLEQARFFLTAHSRAPEVNLFNLPRIATWPVFRDLASGRVSVFDGLLAFCSTINGEPYYFQREVAGHQVSDISLERNVQLYEYLRYLTGNPIPGYGGTFSSKYGADRDQILTEIFDYIRSANLYDDTLAAGSQFTAGRNADESAQIGHGWVVPSKKGNTRGMGRAYTLSELAIGFICNAAADDPGTPEDESRGSNIASGPGMNAVLGGTTLDPNEKYIQALIIPEFFSPMHGYMLMRPDMQVRITGLDALSVTSGTVTAPLFPGLNDASLPLSGDPGLSIAAGRSVGGFCDWRFAVAGKGSPARGFLPGDAGELYPFIGIPVKIPAPATGGTMTFSGGALKVEIYAGATTPQSPDTLLQSFEIVMPAATLPIPAIAPSGLGGASELEMYAWTSKQNWWSFPKRGSVTGYPGRMEYSGWGPGSFSNPHQGQFLRADCDVVRSVMPAHGDYRLIAGRSTVPDDVFVPHPDYANSSRLVASSLGGEGAHLYGVFDRTGQYISTITYHTNYRPDIPPGASGANRPESSGDYDTGISGFLDGPFVNKPDEGNNFRGADGSKIPYFDNSEKQSLPGPTYFSPNRQIPSPGMFGSLPTGVMAGIPWRTLLFRPQSGHFGASLPKDSLLLDFFWMPVVEPYAISDRFSTAGKINMNYQILPFTYIERSTALHALFNSERVVAIPNAKSLSYKQYETPDIFRLPINVDATLSQFKDRFAAGEVFKSASDICDLHIVPQGASVSTMDAFWAAHRLTGDNLRERIYTTLYPRLTTKSNTYTVHFRVQSLRKLPASPAGTWTEDKDLITGEYRGSATIERFIDANNPDIPDYAATPSDIPAMRTLDAFYRWRVIANRQFAP